MGRKIVRRRYVFLLSILALCALGMGPASPVPPDDTQAPDGWVCFWSDQGPVCGARGAADGRGPGPPDPRAWLEALLAGPTAAERGRGMRSAIPPGTKLADVDVRPDRTVVVQLDVLPDALRGLSHASFEAIVEQVGGTLAPLEWRDLRIQARHPRTGEFVPLSNFLPAVEVPRKPAPQLEETDPMALDAASALQGQPPAPGQGQPAGALSGKTVYVSAGHGWQWTGSAWRTQRPPYPDPAYEDPPYEDPIIEDHNNAEAVDQYLLQYLWNAGAMVWPARERDMNAAEGIVDNDAPGSNGYFELGDWTPSASGTEGYAGTNYHYATTVTDTAATATAVWTATLPADGRYAVYVWYRPGPNRAPDARYTVHHAGGATMVPVDQRAHGDTWHYIGTYGFRAGEEARVALDNRSAIAGRAIIADAVRFGGGTFDDRTGIETTATQPPHKPWWEVATFYYAQRMGMDQPPGDVTARPIYARWEHAGTGDDAVYVSWHTNGATGYQTWASGTETYVHSGETLTRTEGSLELRHALQSEVVQDLRAGWDPSWVDRGEKAANFGELRLLWDDDESARMPGALIEIAFHDHPDDTDALKDPRFNMIAARALYQGIVKYFEQRDGIDLPLLPEPPTHLMVRNAGGGRVRLSWRPPLTDTVDLVGDAATGYRVYTSTTGLGWSNGVPAAGTAYTLTGLAEGQTVFVRVTATNAGGESFPTEVLGVRVGDPAEVLVVSGFDRLNRFAMVPENDPVEGYNMRMFLDRMNRYAYAVSHGSVISAPFDSASNEAVAEGLIALGDYTVVDWILGEEASADETLSAAERAALAAYLDGGGALFISGSELGWDLVDQGRDPTFHQTYLHADYAGDDAETYTVSPTSGGIFAGLGPLYFDAAGEYDADFPDRLSPRAGAQIALSYSGGTGDGAAIQYAEGRQRVVYFGFPFETLWPEQRGPVMARVMDFLAPYHAWLPLLMRDFSPPPGACVDALVNGGFETEEAWLFSNQAAYNADPAYVRSGLRSARVGIPPGEPGGEELTYSSIRQEIPLPAGGSATLRLWIYPINEGDDPDDQHYVTLRDGAGVLHILDTTTGDGRAWEERVYDLSDHVGQTVTLYVGARNDGDDDTAALYVDDATLAVCP